MPPLTLENLLDDTIGKEMLISATLSNPLIPRDCQSIKIRPVLVQSKLHYQWTEQRKNQAHHRNVTPQECRECLKKELLQFKQALFCTQEADYQVLTTKAGKATIMKKPPTKRKALALAASHNRAKNYLLPEGEPLPFLIALGISRPDGQIYPQKRDKFVQINRFLEMVDDILEHLQGSETLRIVDFGSGKAYLTFALYYYLRIVKGLSIHIVGVDLKEQVVQECQKLAQDLSYEDLVFQIGDIAHYRDQHRVDVVVCLHACNTATDFALEKALHWEAKVILCVPCCQHELRSQVENEALQPLLKHGIFKERFAALVTDAARAQLLETVGYHVQVLEFIDMEHTPKNLLIRAVRKPKARFDDKAWREYEQFKAALHISPTFERLVNGAGSA